VHVRVRPIRLLTVEREEPLPLSKFIQSTPCHDNRSAHDNKDDCNDDNGINIGGDDSRKDGMHTTFPISQNNEEGGEVLAAAEVITHATRTSGELAMRWPLWHSTTPEAAILFGYNKGENVYAGLRQRVTLLKGALQKPDGYKSILQQSEETLNADQVFKIRNKCAFRYKHTKLQ